MPCPNTGSCPGAPRSRAVSRNRASASGPVSSGRALMTGLQPGTWRVRVQTAGNAGAEGELVLIRAGEEAEVTLQL